MNERARHRTHRRNATGIRRCSAILLTFALAACGGGGGGGGSGSSGPGSSGGGGSGGLTASLQAGSDPATVGVTWSDSGSPDHYVIEANPDGASGYTPIDLDGDGTIDSGDELAASTTSAQFPISVHLADLDGALYRVVARDASGSEVASSAGLALMDVAAESLIGYFKASNTDDTDQFGERVAMADDGSVLAVATTFEASAATGVDGDETDDSANEAGAVYVFGRDGSGGWSQHAYVKASNTNPNDTFGQKFGASIALSADGDTLAVGAHGEQSATTGVNQGGQGDTSADNAGAVYVFTGAGPGTWSQQAYIKASNTDAGDEFGKSIALSDFGGRLAVGAPGEDGSGTGVNSGQQGDDGAPSAGAVYVFTFVSVSGVSTGWQQEAYIKASNSGGGDLFGSSVALADDGDTLAVGARNEGTPGVSDSPPNSGAAYVFTRGSSGWSQQQLLRASNDGESDNFGASVTLSDSGDTLGVGAYGEWSSGTGVNGGAQADDSLVNAGAAYLFDRASGTWSQAAYVKASNTGVSDRFGDYLSLSDDGELLAVGAPGEDSAATAIGGNEADDSATGAGAVYLFERGGTGAWSQRAYVKAPNTANADGFGADVALSGSGERLVVGATDEDSQATGIGGDQTDNSATGAGAAYVY
jgi:hypothetical protein